MNEALQNEIQECLKGYLSSSLFVSQQLESKSKSVIHIDICELMDCCPGLVPLIINQPLYMSQFILQVLRDIDTASHSIIQDISFINPPNTSTIIKDSPGKKLPCNAFYPHRAIVSSDIGRLVCFQGTITRCSNIKTLTTKKTLRCNACNHEFEAHSSPELYYLLDLPSICPKENYCELSLVQKLPPPSKNRKKKNQQIADDEVPKKKTQTVCNNKDFSVIDSSEERIDYMEVRIQEMEHKTSVTAFRGISVALLGRERVDSVIAGQTVTIVGIVLQRWRQSRRGARNETEIFVQASSVLPFLSMNTSSLSDYQIQLMNGFWNDSSLEICKGVWQKRYELLESFCPYLIDCRTQKLALLLQLVSFYSCEKQKKLEDEGATPLPLEEKKKSKWDKYTFDMTLSSPSPFSDDTELSPSSAIVGVTPRKGGGESISTVATVSDTSSSASPIHILVIGDPSSGKSTLLRHALAFAKRSLYVSGCLFSGSQIFCATVKEGGDVHLDPGALPLCHKGICVFDDLSHMKNGDKTLLQEVMDTQVVSIGRFGLHSSLDASVSVLCAVNIKSNERIPSYGPVDSGLPYSLLERFDIILTMRSTHSQEKESDLIENLLEKCSKSQDSKRQEHIKGEKGEKGERGQREEEKAEESLFDNEELLIGYLQYVGENLCPELTEGGNAVIEAYFRALQKKNKGSVVSSRIPLSITKLTKAHAKLLWKKEADEKDAIAVIHLVENASNGQVVGSMSTSGDVVGREFLFGDKALEGLDVIRTDGEYEAWRERLFAQLVVYGESGEGREWEGKLRRGEEKKDEEKGGEGEDRREMYGGGRMQVIGGDRCHWKFPVTMRNDWRIGVEREDKKNKKIIVAVQHELDSDGENATPLVEGMVRTRGREDDVFSTARKKSPYLPILELESKNSEIGDEKDDKRPSVASSLGESVSFVSQKREHLPQMLPVVKEEREPALVSTSDDFFDF